MNGKKVKIAVNGGIDFGAKLNSKQLITIANYLEDEDQLELTTFQQLYLEVPEENKEEIIEEFKQVGLHCYPVGNYVKSLKTCNFCKGEVEEGMPVAKELNKRIVGKPVPFTLKVAYTGCPIGCGEPMLSDIGVMKVKDRFNLYVGGNAKGRNAEVGFLLFENLTDNQLYSAVEQTIDLYARTGKKRATFNKFIKGMDKDLLLNKIII